MTINCFLPKGSFSYFEFSRFVVEGVLVELVFRSSSFLTLSTG